MTKKNSLNQKKGVTIKIWTQDPNIETTYPKHCPNNAGAGIPYTNYVHIENYLKRHLHWRPSRSDFGHQRLSR